MTSGFYISYIDGLYYAYYWDESHGQVKSFGADNSPEGCRFASGLGDEAIKYVASGCKTYHGAYQRIRRHGGQYRGIRK